MFSCEFREISKNTFFTEHLWATASDGKTFRFLWLCYNICTITYAICTLHNIAMETSAKEHNMKFRRTRKDITTKENFQKNKLESTRLPPPGAETVFMYSWVSEHNCYVKLDYIVTEKKRNM